MANIVFINHYRLDYAVITNNHQSSVAYNKTDFFFVHFTCPLYVGYDSILHLYFETQSNEALAIQNTAGHYGREKRT